MYIGNEDTSIWLWRRSPGWNSFTPNLVTVASWGWPLRSHVELFVSLRLDTNRVLLDRLYGGDLMTVLRASRMLADSAITMLSACKEVPVVLSKSYKARSEVHQVMGEYGAALEDHIAYKALSDTIFNQESDKLITLKAVAGEFEKKEAVTRAEQ